MMQLDRKALRQMLTLDDDQLRRLIERLAREAGLPPSALPLGNADLSALRTALSSASDAELARIAAQITAAQNGGGAHGQ